MKRTLLRKTIPSLAIWLGLVGATGAPAGDPPKGSVLEPLGNGPQYLVIEGDSNVKKWTAMGSEIHGRIELAHPVPPGDLETVPLNPTPAVRVSVPVSSLEGDGGRRMDRIMHEALDAGHHPEIVFVLHSLHRPQESPDTPVNGPSGSGPLALEARGDLTVAGTTRTVLVHVRLSDAEHGLQIEGHADLRMTDFGIDPPTALLGVLRSRDDVTVRFSWLVHEVSP